MPTEAESRRQSATTERERPALDPALREPVAVATMRTRPSDREEDFAQLRSADPFDTRRKLTPEEVAILKGKYAEGASDAEFAVFIRVCERTGLDPFTEQIRFLKRRKKNEQEQWVDTFSIQIGIDGARLIATRTGQYQGQTAPQWCGKDGIWKDVWTAGGAPAAARIGVHRRGFVEPLYAIAHFSEYVQKNRSSQPIRMWAAMPAGQLAKCAEALALRKAFPQELSGLYTTDEMAQGLNDEVEETPRPRPTPAARPVSETGDTSESTEDGDMEDVGYRATFMVPFGPRENEPITSSDVSLGTLLRTIEWCKQPERVEQFGLWLEAASAEVSARIGRLSKEDIGSEKFARLAEGLTKTPERKKEFQWVIDAVAERMIALENPTPEPAREENSPTSSRTSSSDSDAGSTTD